MDVIRAAYEAGAGKAWSTLFRCRSPKQASTLAGKFLADIRLFPGVEDVKLDAGGTAVPALSVPGGATFAVSLDGAESRIVIGGTGYSTEIFGPEGVNIVEVLDPDDVTMENIVVGTSAKGG